MNTAIGGASFGEGDGQIWLENVACTGTEESLGMCVHDGIANQDCTHAMDAGVTCQGMCVHIKQFYTIINGAIWTAHNVFSLVLVPWLIRQNFNDFISPSQNVLPVRYNWWVEPH